jgi:glycosyltransferase involved in cell wall biosynthesis
VSGAAPTLSVLHFSTADILGGSARSAYRIHAALRARGHVSRMLVGQRASSDPDVDTVWSGRLGQLADRLADRATSRSGHQYMFLPSTRRVVSHPWVAQAQVFQLYNTHGGYFATHMLPVLSAKAPIVWRLSDMWPMTGHCSYSGSCERWLTGCGECPDLADWPGIGRDRTAELWRMKDALYGRSRITVVAPSSWTERLARESPLLRRFPVRRIPNGIDLRAFRPQEKAAARASLGIDPRARVILFVAHGLDRNSRKGSEDAIQALGQLGARPGTQVVLAGEGGASWIDRLPLPILRLGYLKEEARLSAAYASADVMLSPSRVENLPNTVLESLACGTPVVATDAGGMRDAVLHGETGWLVRVGDTQALADGLLRVLDDEPLRQRMSSQARALAERQFSEEREASSFEALYRELSS